MVRGRSVAARASTTGWSCCGTTPFEFASSFRSRTVSTQRSHRGRRGGRVVRIPGRDSRWQPGACAANGGSRLVGPDQRTCLAAAGAWGWVVADVEVAEVADGAHRPTGVDRCGFVASGAGGVRAGLAARAEEHAVPETAWPGPAAALAESFRTAIAAVAEGELAAFTSLGNPADTAAAIALAFVDMVVAATADRAGLGYRVGRSAPSARSAGVQRLRRAGLAESRAVGQSPRGAAHLATLGAGFRGLRVLAEAVPADPSLRPAGVHALDLPAPGALVTMVVCGAVPANAPLGFHIRQLRRRLSTPRAGWWLGSVVPCLGQNVREPDQCQRTMGIASGQGVGCAARYSSSSRNGLPARAFA